MNNVEKYDFNIMDVIKTSFKMTDGFKGKFLASLGIMIAIMLVFGFVVTFIALALGMNEYIVGNLADVISLPIIVSITAGILMMTVNYTRGESVSYKNIFDYFGNMWKLVGMYLLTVLFVLLPIVLVGVLSGFFGVIIDTTSFNLVNAIVLFVLFLILLTATITYMFAPQLLVDKNLTIWQAMETSRQATWQRLCKIIGLFLAFSVILIISAIPFGIGLIWTLPAMYIGTYGLLYRIIFDGVELNGSK